MAVLIVSGCHIVTLSAILMSMYHTRNDAQYDHFRNVMQPLSDTKQYILFGHKSCIFSNVKMLSLVALHTRAST